MKYRDIFQSRNVDILSHKFKINVVCQLGTFTAALVSLSARVCTLLVQ